MFAEFCGLGSSEVRKSTRVHTSWQATWCSDLFSSSGGSTDLHFVTRIGQRGSRRQPGGGLSGRVTSPLSGDSILFANDATVGLEARRGFVYGFNGRLKISFTSAISMIFPAYI